MGKRQPRPWTRQENTTLKSLIDAGYQSQQIEASGRLPGRSRSAICGQANRKGWTIGRGRTATATENLGKRINGRAFNKPPRNSGFYTAVKRASGNEVAAVRRRKRAARGAGWLKRAGVVSAPMNVSAEIAAFLARGGVIKQCEARYAVACPQGARA